MRKNKVSHQDTRPATSTASSTPEHPSWCSGDCWTVTTVDRVHEVSQPAHTWTSGTVESKAQLVHHRYSENKAVGPGEDTDYTELLVDNSELGEVTVIGTFEDFERLGAYLLDAAANLRRIVDEGDAA